jgi:hypothetical protein
MALQISFFSHFSSKNEEIKWNKKSKLYTNNIMLLPEKINQAILKQSLE